MSLENISPLETVLGRWGLANSLIEPLPGDGGARYYFRLLPSGSSESLIAVMDQSGQAQTNRFLFWQKYLADHAIPVPAVRQGPELIQTSGRGNPKNLFQACLLEDLGETHLGDQPAAFPALEKRALAHLARLATLPVPDEYPPLVTPPPVFGRKKSFFELVFLLRNIHPRAIARSGQGVTDRFSLAARGSLPVFRSWARQIDQLTRQRGGLCHRDFHGRNIMVVEDDIVLIDFQDIMIAPAEYDLVSFLFDPYRDFSTESIQALVEIYREEIAARERRKHEWTKEDLALFAFQRLYKAMGSFFFIARTRSKPYFLDWVPVALGKLSQVTQWTRVPLPGALSGLNRYLAEMASLLRREAPLR